MRIYIINCNYGHGGPGGIVKDLYNGFIRKGEECRVAYSRNFREFDGVNSYKIGNKFNIMVHAFFSRIFDCQGRLSYIPTLKMIRDIKRYDPDIINLHNLNGYFLNYKLFFRFLNFFNGKIVWTAHDCSLFTGHCINFERISCNKWQMECNKCSLKKDYPKSLFFDNSTGNYRLKKKWLSNIKNMEIVSPSNWLKRHIENSFLKNIHVQVINNGIDLSAFEAKKRENSDKIKLLAVAGVWNEMKGIDVLVELASMLPEEFELTLVGDIPKNMEIPPSVCYVRRTNSVEKLAELYSAADIFINPTLGDNYPTVNIEALACGTPIVTFDTGGSKEIVGECGHVVCKKNAESLLEGIHGLHKKKILSDACRKRATLFSKDQMINDYLDLFCKLLKKEG